MPDQNLFEIGLLFFNSADYYQAHEVWEDLWRITEGPDRVFYQGLIQAAVGLYHFQRGNETGARGQLSKSISHLAQFSENPQLIDTAGLIQQLQEIQNGVSSQPVLIARIK